MNDNVNHPSHYTDGKIEVIDFIEDKKLNYHLGNAVKYIARAGKKDPDKYIEDLQKAIWYLQREVNRLSLSKLFSEPIKVDHFGTGVLPLRNPKWSEGTVTIQHEGATVGKIDGKSIIDALNNADGGLEI